jgi:fatty-acid desaturase
MFSDTEHDPYGVNKGFWHAHIGWILFWRHRTNYDNVKDLRRSRWLSTSTSTIRGGPSAEASSSRC